MDKTLIEMTSQPYYSKGFTSIGNGRGVSEDPRGGNYGVEGGIDGIKGGR